MKKKNIFLLIPLSILVIILFFPISSQPYMEMTCKKDEHKKDDVEFVLEINRSQLDLIKDNYFLPLQIRVNIHTNENISNIVMQSYCLRFNEIDVEISNNNYNRESEEALYVSDIYKYTRQCMIEISLDEMRDAIANDISNDELYKMIKRIRTAEYQCLIKYEINNKQRENNLIFEYDVKFNKGKTYVWEMILYMILYMIFGGH